MTQSHGEDGYDEIETELRERAADIFVALRDDGLRFAPDAEEDPERIADEGRRAVRWLAISGIIPKSDAKSVLADPDRLAELGRAFFEETEGLRIGMVADAEDGETFMD